MTPRQKQLARHALGLPNDSKQAYRNNFVTGPGNPDHVEWSAMVDAGLAKVTTQRREIYGGMDVFWLTRTGAEAAIGKGEKLERWYPGDPKPGTAATA